MANQVTVSYTSTRSYCWRWTGRMGQVQGLSRVCDPAIPELSSRRKGRLAPQQDRLHASRTPFTVAANQCFPIQKIFMLGFRDYGRRPGKDIALGPHFGLENSLSRSNVIPMFPRISFSLMSSVRFEAVKEIGIWRPESPTGIEYLAWNTPIFPGRFTF
jgi:hypothetical protein